MALDIYVVFFIIVSLFYTYILFLYGYSDYKKKTLEIVYFIELGFEIIALYFLCKVKKELDSLPKN